MAVGNTRDNGRTRIQHELGSKDAKFNDVHER